MKSLVYFSLCCSVLSAGLTDIPDLIPRPVHQPFSEPPLGDIDADYFSKLKAKSARSAEDEYELALHYIVVQEWPQAIVHLQAAIGLKPNFDEAHIQLGFVYVWMGQIEDAAPHFQVMLTDCQPQAILGLTKIVSMLPYERGIDLCLALIRCQPDNSDLWLLLGRLYDGQGKTDEAIAAIEKARDLSPEDPDPPLLLIKIAYQNKRWSQVEALYKRHPSDPAIQTYYARTLREEGHYKRAFALIEGLSSDRVGDRERADLRARARPEVCARSTYTSAKESDPDFHRPVVRDFYLWSSLRARLPLTDFLELDIEPFGYNQKERDILPPTGLNYDVYENGANVVSRLLWRDFRLDFLFRGFSASGHGHEVYPFQDRARYEPGVVARYQTAFTVACSAYDQSEIIKNFARGRSDLLKESVIDAIVAYHPDIRFRPGIDAYGGWIFYKNFRHNRENRQSLSLSSDLWTRCLTATYLWEHSGFDHLNRNYYSYMRQVRNTVSGKISQNFLAHWYADFTWDHTWENTYDLYQPIGNFVFVADQQYLIWNCYTIRWGCHYRDRLDLEWSAHYLYNTLPYVDWNVQGSLLWRF